MSTRTSEKPGRWRAGLAAITSALFMAITVIAAAPASAATIPNAIDPASIVSVKNTGSTGQVYTFDRLRISGQWSVPDGSQPGDTFSMTLPSELSAYTSDFDLAAPDGSPVGHCVVVGTSAVMTCTLNDYVLTHTDVHGDFFFLATAARTTSSNTGTYVVDGTNVDVTWNEGGTGSGIINAPTPPATYTKTGVYSNNPTAGQRLSWSVTVTAAQVQNDTLHLSDTLLSGGTLDGHHWAGYPAAGVVVQLADASNTFAGGVPVSRITGGWDATGKSLDATVNLAGLDYSHGVRFTYYTVPDDGTFLTGDTFGNRASADGTRPDLEATITLSNMGGGTGSGTDFGRLSFTKTIAGDAASLIPAGTNFTVEYTTPTTSGTVSVPMDGSVAQTPTLPRGQQVTIEEIDLPVIEGVEWSDPVFAATGLIDNGDGTYTAAIVGGQTLAISVTNTANAPVVPKVGVGDYVWFDKDRDGRQDEGEAPIPGVTLTITRADGEPVVDVNGNTVTTTVTDENGYYWFGDLPPAPDGTYIVTPTNPEGYVPTTPNAGDTTGDSNGEHGIATGVDRDGAEDPTLDFGYVLKTYAVGDYVWIDEDGDGRQDDGEPVLRGVTVSITDADGNPVTDADGNMVESVTTDSEGRYIFDNLLAGDYIVKFVLTDEQAKTYTFTSLGDGDATDSDAGTGGYTSVISLGDSNTALTKDYDRDIIATEGIDPTWDAGVVLIKPVEPEEPTKPGTPEEPVTPTTPEGNLAVTGGSAPVALFAAGVLLLLIGGGVVARRSRKS